MNTRRATLTLATLLIAATAATGTTARAGLSTESPFAPRGQTVGPVTSNTPIELRGITSDEQGPRFAIYDPIKKDGAWVGLDEKGRAFTVRSYDEATNRVVVDYQGKAQTIALVEPKFGPGKAVAGAIAMPGVVAQPGVAAAQPFQNRFVRPGQDQTQQRAQQQGADEAKRLEAIRAEVARRRAQREASAQQGQQQQGQQQQPPR
ncbi:MAG: hypothetical protein LBM04_04575 [Opitutaceae bacterium]|nr:hypothetical protein [Opitutaceae bacterium]